MKFIAVQAGARRGYAVPAILERAGMLERFYTDMCGSMGVGAAVAYAARVPGTPTALRRLAARRLPNEVIRKTRTFDRPALQREWQAWRNNGDVAAAARRGAEFSRRWGAAMVRAGFGSATHVFSMLGEGGPFLVEAKRRGLTVVCEVYIQFSADKIVAAERLAFPEWEPASPDFADLRRAAGVQDALDTSTDYYICPSLAVRDDLIANWGIEGSRTAIVPYGMDPRWLTLERRTTPGRILFVGTADLRKGIHYLAMAAERLAARLPDAEFRVAGHVSPQIAARPECRRLNFLGRVPRDRIHEEFQQADIFVLPSLAEGSAEVTYEALAAGVPVVTTVAAGSVVRDGVDGVIVLERDDAALSDAIEHLVNDRSLREQMSDAARERAADFTWERYGERLVGALRQCHE